MFATALYKVYVIWTFCCTGKIVFMKCEDMSTCQWPSKGKIKCTYKVSDEVPNQGLQEKLCKAEQDYFGAPGIG
jgi:hypothetical protein